MMKELFFSLISRKLFIAILVNNQVIRTICEDNYQKHSENFILKIKEIFTYVSFSINDLNKIFFLTGPGGQTGERISISFILASLLSKPTIKVFFLDSLTFQAAEFKKCLSIINSYKKTRKYHGVHENKKVLLRGEKVEEKELNKIRENFQNLSTKSNLEEIDFLDNFLLCKEKFKLFTSI